MCQFLCRLKSDSLLDTIFMNEKAIVPKSILPEIVDETGKAVTGPEMEAVLGLVIQLANNRQLARIRESLEKEEFEGKEDPRTLDATDELKFITFIGRHPYTPWITAYFINDGPDSVRISLNRPYAQFELGVNETITVDRAHADERIRIVYYVCDPGETASVRVIGQF